MHGRSRIAWLIALVLAVGVTTSGERTAAAQGDRIAELTQTLSSSSEKARLSAVIALGKLGDRRTMKPLVTALADPSPQIRAVAAAALGRLGHKAALPALKGCATDDTDDGVRKSARSAAIAVAKANQLPPPWQDASASASTRAAATMPRKAGRPGFGNQPRALEPSPELYVLVNSSADDSPGKTDKAARKVHAEVIRAALTDSCKSTPVITTVAADAKRLGLESRHIDVSVVRMDVATVGTFVEVDAQLRLAISDDKGKMMSFLSGGAKVQVPKHKFDARYLPNLRREALENAVRGMFDKLLAHLRELPAS